MFLDSEKDPMLDLGLAKQTFASFLFNAITLVGSEKCDLLNWALTV